jgi:hypothetical protein
VDTTNEMAIKAAKPGTTLNSANARVNAHGFLASRAGGVWGSRKATTVSSTPKSAVSWNSS